MGLVLDGMPCIVFQKTKRTISTFTTSNFTRRTNIAKMMLTVMAKHC